MQLIDEVEGKGSYIYVAYLAIAQRARSLDLLPGMLDYARNVVNSPAAWLTFKRPDNRLHTLSFRHGDTYAGN